MISFKCIPRHGNTELEGEDEGRPDFYTARVPLAGTAQQVSVSVFLLLPHPQWTPHEAGCSQEEGPKKAFVMGSRARGVQEILEKCM